LALDDFHLITIPEVLKDFSYFVNYLSPRVHVILISRTEPRLELAKLRLGGNLLRIDLHDLQFRTEEIAQFYHGKGLTFEREELDRIEQYTQGWAAALVAVAMDPEGKQNREWRDLGGQLNRSGQLIDQFLEEELVGKWSEEKRNFLLKTAFLDSLCGPLCDAVTGLRGGGEMLRGLWFQNEFLIALDDENYWYRYHPLFRDFLRKMLARQTDQSLPELYLKAACWHRENGLIDPAIDYYVEARQFDAAVELISSRASLLFTRGEYSRLFAWLDRLPEELIGNYPQIIAVQVRYYTENNLFDEAQKCLARMWKLVYGSSNGQNYAMDSQLKKGVLLVEAYSLICQGNLTGFLAKFKAAAAIDAVQSILSQNYLDLNLSEIYLYRCRACFGIINLFKSDPQGFRQMISEYRKMIPRYPGFAPLIAAEFYYEANRPDEALPYLVKAIDEAIDTGCPGSLVPAMVTIARIKRSQNEITAAFDAIRECEKRLLKINRPHWNYLLNAFKARLDLDFGRTAAVEEWLATSKLQIYQEITRTSEYELLVLARVLMSRRRFGDTAILLQRLLTFAEAEKRLHSLVEILNLLAITAAQVGDIPKALDLLEKSLVIGLREGFCRSFVDEFAPMAALLEQYLLPTKERLEPDDEHREKLIAYAVDLLAVIQNSQFKTAFMAKEQSNVRTSVKCFGSFAIYQDGQPLVCKNSKAREILAYLVHNRGNPVGWEKIVEAVWPDCPYESAHSNFHATMYLLRKFLSSHSLLDILDCSRGNYRICPEKIDCDVDEFGRILAENDHTSSQDPQLIAAARKLYTGGYFEDDGFIWAYAKAAKLEMMVLKLHDN
jgi:LuxR family maltose regulon positive regulatory protein